MTRQFCDRCGADVTQKESAVVRMIGDADSQGNGAVTSEADLCQRCRSALETWLATTTLADAAAARTPTKQKRKAHA